MSRANLTSGYSTMAPTPKLTCSSEKGKCYMNLLYVCNGSLMGPVLCLPCIGNQPLQPRMGARSWHVKKATFHNTYSHPTVLRIFLPSSILTSLPEVLQHLPMPPPWEVFTDGPWEQSLISNLCFMSVIVLDPRIYSNYFLGFLTPLTLPICSWLHSAFPLNAALHVTFWL